MPTVKIIKTHCAQRSALHSTHLGTFGQLRRRLFTGICRTPSLLNSDSMVLFLLFSSRYILRLPSIEHAKIDTEPYVSDFTNVRYIFSLRSERKYLAGPEYSIEIGSGRTSGIYKIYSLPFDETSREFKETTPER